MLVVEDQAAMRALVCDLLTRHGFDAFGAADAAEATRVFAEVDPDVLLTDIDLGSRPSGAELAAMLTALAPHLGVVFLSSYPRAAAGARVMGIDRAQFVSKQSLDVATDLLRALSDALSTHPTVAAGGAPEHDGLGALTRRQLEVLALIARGASNEQIALETGVSMRAVERAISRIFDRLGVTGDPTRNPRVAAAALYLASFGPSR